MQAHGDWIGDIRLADNNGDRTAAHRIAENDETGARPGIERHRCFARDCERSNGVVAKARNRLGFDRDDVRRECGRIAPRDIGGQHRRQSVRQLDQLDRRRSRRSGRPGIEVAGDLGIRNER